MVHQWNFAVWIMTESHLLILETSTQDPFERFVFEQSKKLRAQDRRPNFDQPPKTNFRLYKEIVNSGIVVHIAHENRVSFQRKQPTTTHADESTFLGRNFSIKTANYFVRPLFRLSVLCNGWNSERENTPCKIMLSTIRSTPTTTHSLLGCFYFIFEKQEALFS